jgi:ankyrin repeat protein
LEYAVLGSAVEVVELLLSKDCNPNNVTLDGDASLHLAVRQGNVGVVERLIAAGADVNQLNRYSQTPAAVLLSQPSHEKGPTALRACLEALAEAGCEFGKTDLLGRHLLHLAQLAEDAHAFQISTLLSKPGEANQVQHVDIFGCTAEDYSLDMLTTEDLAQLRRPDPWSAWFKERKLATSRTVDWQTRSKSFEEMMETLVQDVSVDLADFVAFVVFLESFADWNVVVKFLQDYVSNGSQGTSQFQ